MKLVYFAAIRETLGRSSEEISPPSEVTTIEELINWLKQKEELYASAFSGPAPICAAINQAHVPLSTSIKSAQEIAFFPPVTGG